MASENRKRLSDEEVRESRRRFVRRVLGAGLVAAGGLRFLVNDLRAGSFEDPLSETVPTAGSGGGERQCDCNPCNCTCGCNCQCNCQAQCDEVCICEHECLDRCTAACEGDPLAHEQSRDTNDADAHVLPYEQPFQMNAVFTGEQNISNPSAVAAATERDAGQQWNIAHPPPHQE